MKLRHLARRLATSLSRREPAVVDTDWAEAQLLPDEVALWRRMSVADRRHAIEVAYRFDALGGPWTREELAGALLHDVGKLQSGLSTLSRVAATIVGPRTTRFRLYHDHERIGGEMLVAAGSSPVTVDLVRGHGRATQALLEADNI
jgi:hypothetical protein